jgi:hypothetical protein
MTGAPGPWAVPNYGHLDMRAADADRDRAIDVLKAGFAEGRLTIDELELRQTQALAARTYRELAALTADLPTGPLGALALRPATGPGYGFPVARKTNRLAIASLICAFVPVYGTVLAIVLGHTARKQIRVSREGGAGLAAVGMGIGYLFVGFWVFMLLAMVIR